ncbi:MAG: histidine kinase [Saprospiraceae bacterium]|nr:histidine kinase [Saprospiraceae bacterium]
MFDPRQIFGGQRFADSFYALVRVAPCCSVILMIFLFAISTANSMLGQSPYFVSHSFDKVSTTRVNILQQDDQGFVWFGCDQGLYRYDGLSYQPFHPSDTHQLQSVTALYCANNEVWVGYEDGRIYYLGPSRKLIAWTPEEGLPDVAITGIARDQQGRLWFSTYGEGVFVQDVDHLYNINREDGLLENQIYDMELDREGQVWLATDIGLNICQFENKIKLISSLTNQDGLLDEIVYTLKTDDSGMWIGFHRGGFCHYSLAGDSIDFYTKDWQFGSVRALYPNAGDRIWVGTEDMGVLSYQVSGSNSNQQINVIDEFKNQECHQIFCDRENNVWVAMNHHSVYSAIGNVEILRHDLGDVQAICEDAKRQVWIGSQHGLFKLEEGNLVSTEWRAENIISLYEDKYGKIWFGTFGNGVVCWDPVSGRSLKLTEKQGLANGSILSIDGFEDRIWLATLGGIVEIYNEANLLTKQRIKFLNLHTDQGLNASFFYKVFVDREGIVWFGTDGQGVIKLEHEVTTNLLSSGILPVKTIYSITQDGQGNIWFGTNDDGVYSFDGDSSYHLGIDQGLTSLSINSIAADQAGNILMVHDNGFDLYDPITKTIRYYNENAGLGDLKPALNAVSRGRGQSILIGGQNMVARYISVEQITQIYPLVIFDEIKLFNDPFDFKVRNSFGYNENFIQFNYVGLWHCDPQDVTYEYLLEGYDMDWRESRDQEVSYSKLTPGNYNFRVRSVINKQAFLSSEINYSFYIRAPFWFKAWFLTLFGLLAGATIYGYQRFRELRISRNAALERERIESQYEVLKAQINPHFLFNSFNTLASIVEEDSQLAIEYIEKLSDYYRSIIQFRNQKMISLAEELILIDDFTYLLKRRFGKNLQVIKQIESTDFYIPPLTLQMLVENAVKHNVISRQKPLTIAIRSENDDYLVVSNNLQPKKTEEPSTRFGLQNIQTRFELLTKKKVIIEDHNGHFSVSIPLLKINAK